MIASAICDLYEFPVQRNSILRWYNELPMRQSLQFFNFLQRRYLSYTLFGSNTEILFDLFDPKAHKQ